MQCKSQISQMIHHYHKGYTFEAETNGQLFTVTVPIGGVEEGQKFSVPFPSGQDGYSGVAEPRSRVPAGYWKDDVCACCGLGLCHTVLWNAWCCPLIMLGQVMHRLKLTWTADAGGTTAQTSSTFRILFWIGIITWILINFVPYLPRFFLDEYGQPTDAYFNVNFLCQAVVLVYAIYKTVLICKTRKYIREQYGIPEQQCHGCEDCCCSWWCSCCTLSQMARHTGDYDAYAGVCCNETGLPPHAPSIV
eukprot:218079_1